MENNKINEQWLTREYLAKLTSYLNTDMTYLHSTLTWAITILVAGMGFVFGRESYPDHLGFFGLLFILIILIHFGNRTAKAYMNVMRWSSVDKQIISYKLNEGNENDFSIIIEKIKKYHCNWVSPLKKRTVAYKVLFELGFGYFFFIIFIGIAYTISIIDITIYHILALIFAIILSFIEIWAGLLRSSYFKKIDEDFLAERLK